MATRFSDLDIASASPCGPRTDRPQFKYTIPRTYPEAQLFALLLWRLGPPNGPMSLALPPGGDPDAPWKWDFIFSFAGGPTISILRSWLDVEIWVWDAKVDKLEAISFVDFNLARYTEEINKSLDSLERYHLILNPYVRHKKMVDLAAGELDNITVKEPFYPQGLVAPKGAIQQHNKTFQAFLRAVDRASFFSVTLAIESAFLAEAFLNLLLALLRNDHLAGNKKLFEEALKATWTTKIEKLPLNCQGVPKSPDMGDIRIRNAGRLFDLRNRIAHSYPDKDALAIGQIWFFKNTPILPTASPWDLFQAGVGCMLPTREESIKCRKYAEELIQFLKELLSPNALRMLELFSRTNPLGFNEAKQIFSIPFGDTVVKVFIPRKQ